MESIIQGKLPLDLVIECDWSESEVELLKSCVPCDHTYTKEVIGSCGRKRSKCMKCHRVF